MTLLAKSTPLSLQIEEQAIIAGFGRIGRATVCFDEVREFDIHSFSLLSARDLARARIEAGTASSLARVGGYVREGVLYFAHGNPILVSYSPLLQCPDEVVAAHRNGLDYHLSVRYLRTLQRLLECDASKEPQQRRAMQLNQRHTQRIPVTDFGKEAVTLFLFKDQATLYAKFLEQCELTEIVLSLSPQREVNVAPQPFARQLWYEGIRHINGDTDNLDIPSDFFAYQPQY